MSMEHDPFGVHIGAREIYDQLVGLRDDVRSLIQDGEDTDRVLEDHEDRLRAIERWKYGVPLAALAALVSAAVSLVRGSGVI